MNDARKKLNADLDWSYKKIDDLKKRLETFPVELLQQAFPEAEFGDWWGYYYRITLPLNFELEAVFRQFCVDQGWEMEKLKRAVWENGEAKDWAEVYTDPENKSSTNFQVEFYSKKAGATCIVQQIGEEVRPVYEVVCSKGAEEGSF